MALRSLVVMLKKGLPRRMPGSGAFAPKGNLWSKISARLPTKSGSVEETTLSKTMPELHERMKLDHEVSLRKAKVHNAKLVLMGIVGFGALGYRAINA